MENQHKQRIVGAIVMAVTLTVFLFFLLYHSSAPEVPSVLNTLPKAASQKVSEISFELPASTTQAQSAPVAVVTSPVQKVVAAPAPLPAVIPPKSAPTQKAAVSVSAPIVPVITSVKPITPVPPLVVKKVAVPAGSPVIAASPVAPKKEAPELRVLQMMAPPEAWVLQVGTFSSTWRANHLVAQLRAKGLDAYMRTAAHSHGRVSVFVGPKIHRADIENIRDQLAHDFHLHGVIRKYQL